MDTNSISASSNLAKIDDQAAALASGFIRSGTGILRYGLAIVLLWIGGMKFTAYEAAGVAPLVIHSPLMSWAYYRSR